MRNPTGQEFKKSCQEDFIGQVVQVSRSCGPGRTIASGKRGITATVTVDSGQAQVTGTCVSGGGVTLVLTKLGGGAGRRSNGKCRVNRDEFSFSKIRSLVTMNGGLTNDSTIPKTRKSVSFV